MQWMFVYNAAEGYQRHQLLTFDFGLRPTPLIIYPKHNDALKNGNK